MNSPVDAASPQVAADVWGPGVARGLTAEERHDTCAAILARDQVEVTAGWFNEMLPPFTSDLRFAVVSIDSDLYESAASVLEYLIGRQTYSDCCVVFVDDWYCNPGSPEYGEREAWADYTAKPCRIHRLRTLFGGRAKVHTSPMNRDFGPLNGSA
jgi:Macrocin-O-methyltransferase (TylF)